MFCFHLAPGHGPNNDQFAIQRNIAGADNIGLMNMAAGQYDFLWFDVVTGATVQQNVVLSFYMIAANAFADGDFDMDFDVDEFDLAIWQDGLGTQAGATRGQGDADGDTDVDGNDFLRWQTDFTGPRGGLSAGSAVPEPASLLQIVAALVCMALGRYKTIILG